MPMPSQPQVRAYNTDHITEHAGHWEDLSKRIRSVWSAVKGQSDGLDYHGPSAQQMRSVVDGHHDNAHTQADLLDTAAKDARNDAVLLSGQQRSILNTVDETAAQQGFSVGAEWEVTDEQYEPGTMAWIARIPDAEALQAELAQQLVAFTGQEYATGLKMSQHSVSLGGQDVTAHVQMLDNKFKLDGTGSGSGIQMVGHGFKTDTPTPSPPGDQHYALSGPTLVGTTPGGAPVARMPSAQHMPQGPVLNNHGGKTPVPPDPHDKNCSVAEIGVGGAEVVGGAATVAGGLAQGPTPGGVALDAGGLGGILKGADTLTHCNNVFEPPLDAPETISPTPTPSPR